MFICDECSKGRVDEFWAVFGGRSYGPCEGCGKMSNCIDVHHSHVKPYEKHEEKK